MLALVQAHTHGVNWELWISLFIPISTILGGIGKWINRKLVKLVGQLELQDRSKLEFERSVNEQHKDLGERVSRLEGPIQRTERAVKS